MTFLSESRSSPEGLKSRSQKLRNYYEITRNDFKYHSNNLCTDCSYEYFSVDTSVFDVNTEIVLARYIKFNAHEQTHASNFLNLGGDELVLQVGDAMREGLIEIGRASCRERV